MLTVILAAYLVLSLMVGILIYSACVVADRSDKAIQAGEKRMAKDRKMAGVKHMPAKPAFTLPTRATTSATARRAASVYPSRH